MTTENQTPKQKLSRRDFLKLTWTALAALAAFEVGGVILAYMQPRLGEGEFGGEINAGNAADFPPGSVSHISNGRFYLVRLADGKDMPGGFLALYQRCTHLGCNVPWDQGQGTFICPCHNSQFTTQGEVLNPPAPRPLDYFPITIRDGQVFVNTRQPIQRQHFNLEQVAYA